MKTWIALIATATVLASGCSPQAREKYGEAGESVGSAAQKTTDAMATDAEKTGEVVKSGVSAAGDKARQVGSMDSATDAVQTGKVKTALLAATDVKATNLNVDTVGNKVILKGTVPSQQQKTRAGQIAQKEAGNGYTVSNELVVQP